MAVSFAAAMYKHFICLSVTKCKLIYDRQSVGQSVLVPGTHLGPVTNFFSLLEIFFRQLPVCYFVALSLTRGRVCNLLYNCFWSLPKQSLLGRSPAELTAIFYCLISDCVPSSSPLTTRRDYGGGILTRLHTGISVVLLPVLLITPRHGRVENTVPLLHCNCYLFFRFPNLFAICRDTFRYIQQMVC
jgi:hypothetical protein